MPAAAPLSPILRLIHQLGRLPTLGRLAICASLGVGAWLLPPPGLHGLNRVVAAWDAYAWSLLLLC